MSAITDPKKIHLNDPGHPEICNIFHYYKAFFPEKAKEIEKECKAGNIGCVACKKELAKELNKFLDPIRDKRSKFEKKPKLIKEILEQGRVKTEKKTQQTLNLVKQAMGIDYST